MVSLASARGWFVCCLALAVSGCAGDAALEDQHPGPFATKDGVHIRVAFPFGALEGKVVHHTREFLGIPYAKPPLGALRFAPAQPAGSWRGVRDASRFGPACPQPEVGPYVTGEPMDEDCLTLNVFAPQPPPQQSLPVIAFVHGGGFVFGSSSPFDGVGLSEAGPVIVVTLNYRLGPLGFFCHPELDAMRDGVPSGNDGLRDQQLALRWIRENIAAFGGDPHNVTLAGHSTGSTSVCFHLVAPSSRGLAQQLIMQSNECIQVNRAIDKRDAVALNTSFSDAFCSGESGPAIIDCLREQDALELAAFGSEQSDLGGVPVDRNPGWKPVIDGPGGILPRSADDLLTGAQSDDVPVIIGSTRREMAQLQLLGISPQVGKAELEAFITDVFAAEHVSAILMQYRADNDEEANEAYVRLTTDLFVRCPTRRLARRLSPHRDVYLYNFDEGEAVHGDDVRYVFGDDVARASSPALVEVIQGYWTRFAKDGDPNGADAPDWPRYSEESDQHMILKTMPESGTGLAEDDCDLWDEVAPDGAILF